jgi:hypothetical protein
MRQEMDLFELFTGFSKTPDEELSYNLTLMTYLDKVPKNLTQAEDNEYHVELCKLFIDGAFHEPFSKDDIDKIVKGKAKKDSMNLLKLLRELARIQVLDITKEISLLREVKDVQDELNIMTMLFEDQRAVLASMDKLVTSFRNIRSPSQDSARWSRNSKEKEPENDVKAAPLSQKGPGIEEDDYNVLTRLGKPSDEIWHEVTSVGKLRISYYCKY